MERRCRDLTGSHRTRHPVIMATKAKTTNVKTTPVCVMSTGTGVSNSSRRAGVWPALPRMYLGLLLLLLAVGDVMVTSADILAPDHASHEMADGDLPQVVPVVVTDLPDMLASGDVSDEGVYLGNVLPPGPGKSAVSSPADSDMWWRTPESPDTLPVRDTQSTQAWRTRSARSYYGYQTDQAREELVTDKIEMPAEKPGLRNLVTSLHSQLRESRTAQARTR